MKEAFPRPVLDYLEWKLYPRHGNDRPSWTWEFLRRNPDYQRHSAEWNDPALVEARSRDQMRWRRWMGHRNPDGTFRPAGPILDTPEWKALEAKHHELLRERKALFPMFQLDVPAWNDDTMAGPELVGRLNRFPFELPHHSDPTVFEPLSRILLSSTENVLGPHVSERAVVLVLDAGAPEEPQIEVVRQLLEIRRMKLRERGADLPVDASRARRDDGPKYAELPEEQHGVRMLQVLDGLASGAKPKLIQNAFEPGEFDPKKQFYRSKERALRYRDRDWMKLLARRFG